MGDRDIAVIASYRDRAVAGADSVETAGGSDGKRLIVFEAETVAAACNLTGNRGNKIVADYGDTANRID